MTIRKAMQELKVWASDTSFTLIDHVENNRSTPLIKEWRGNILQCYSYCENIHVVYRVNDFDWGQPILIKLVEGFSIL